MQKHLQRILVVEDHKTSAEYLAYLLKAEGYQTAVAEDGNKALRLVSKYNFHLVLLDLALPDIEGLEILSSIRKKYTQTQLPVVVVSAHSDEKRILEALSIGANDFISKPYTEITLKIKVKNLLQLQQSDQNLRQTIVQKDSLYKQQLEIFRSLPIAAILIDQNNRIVDMNMSATELFGYQINNTNNDCFGEVFRCQKKLQSDIQCGKRDICQSCLLKKVIETTFETGGVSKEEGRFVAFHGEAIEYDFSVSSTLLEYNEKRLALLTIDDLTSERKTQRALKESEEKLRVVLRNFADPVFILNAKNLQIIDTNKAVEDVYGYSEEEIQVLNMNSIEKSGKSANYLENYGKINKKQIFEAIHIKKDNTEFPVEVHNSLLNFQNQGLIISVCRDITKRKDTENKLIKYSKELKELNATKDRFFSIIAHDLRSPFNSLLGFSDLLVSRFDRYSDEKKIHLIKAINEISGSASILLDNLLAWSRSQSGRIKYKFEELPVSAMVEDIIDLYKQIASKKQITIINMIDRSTYIYADKNTINTVLRNLISNALKFTPRYGTITIWQPDAEEDNNKYVTISVDDTGIGMDSDILNALFKLDNDSIRHGTEEEKGTGLGLILCKEFIEDNGGMLMVESKPNDGSRFIFTLPKPGNNT